MERKDLVALVYCENSCYTNVYDIDAVKDPSFRLNLKKGNWDYIVDGGRLLPLKNIPIGGAREGTSYGGSNTPYRQGVIGVYDKTNTRHLNSMVFDAIQAVGSRPAEED